MRISVEQILDALVAGVPEQELLEDYPMLEPDDIRAALLHAREAVAFSADHESEPRMHEWLTRASQFAYS